MNNIDNMKECLEKLEVPLTEAHKITLNKIVEDLKVKSPTRPSTRNYLHQRANAVNRLLTMYYRRYKWRVRRESLYIRICYV